MDKKIIPGAEPIFYKGDENGIMLLHGFSSSPYEMKPMAELFKPGGYTIKAPLLCGHGTSVKELAQYKWYDWFTDAKKSLFELRKSCKKVIVVGLSTGASLALHLAAHYQVEGIVALAPALYLKRKLSRLIPYAPPFLKYYRDKKGSDIRDPVEKAKNISYKKTSIRAAKELLKLYDHLKSDLPEIYSPLLVVHSINDHTVQIKGAEEIYERVSSKDKRFLKLEKSYHVLTLDVDKEIIFRETKVFADHIFKET